MASSRCPSSEVSTQQTFKRSNSNVSPGPSSTSSSSGSTVRPVTPRGESRVDCHQRNSASMISGNNNSTVTEATSVADRLSTTEPLEKEACSQILTDLKNYPPVQVNWGAYTSTNQSATSDIPWPMWTVSHMMTLSSPAKVISHYRSLKLADHLNDKELRSFLDEQLCKEKAGLSEVTITMRLRTRVMLEVGENPETCSICMVEFKDQDTVASLYYCTHEYHANCIKEWLRKCNLCPMCRALAIIPENYPSWEADVKLHQAYFVHVFFPVGDLVIEGFIFTTFKHLKKRAYSSFLAAVNVHSASAAAYPRIKLTRIDCRIDDQ